MKMKVSMPFMKLLIRLIILMILFVMIFLISTVLYSARYWPDVYNYINANITIKRIPTLSELNLTIIEVDYVTEMYTTTDMEYMDVSTVDDFDLDEFTLDEVEIKNERKRSILIEKPKDYIELPSRPIFIDYIFLDDPSTTKEANNEFTTTKTVNEGVKMVDSFDDCEKSPKETIVASNEVPIEAASTTREGYLIGDSVKSIFLGKSIRMVELLELTTVTNEEYEVDESSRIMKDLVDESKLTTRDWNDVEMISRKPEKMTLEMADPTCLGNETCQDFAKSVFPWLATIFIKNDSNSDQFSYYCDGALLSDRVIITDARCLNISNKTSDPNHVLVFLGKGSLQVMGGHEKVQRIKEIILHENFTTEGKVENDLALLVTEEPVEYTDAIQNACVSEDYGEDIEEAATTAWGLNGELIPIFFNKEKSDTCNDKDDDIFCATYGNHVAFCPSYGGAYAAKRANKWCLQGIFYGDPVERGICFTKDVYYTSLKSYSDWIDDVIELNKNDL